MNDYVRSKKEGEKNPKKNYKKEKIMACQVSILGPRGYEPRTLPLRHMPNTHDVLA